MLSFFPGRRSVSEAHLNVICRMLMLVQGFGTSNDSHYERQKWFSEVPEAVFSPSRLVVQKYLFHGRQNGIVLHNLLIMEQTAKRDPEGS